MGKIWQLDIPAKDLYAPEMVLTQEVTIQLKNSEFTTDISIISQEWGFVKANSKSQVLTHYFTTVILKMQFP